MPTNYMRYARSDFMDDISSETPLPMTVDAELGMPLDLGLFESLWETDADDSGAQYRKLCSYLTPQPNLFPHRLES